MHSQSQHTLEGASPGVLQGAPAQSEIRDESERAISNANRDYLQRVLLSLLKSKGKVFVASLLQHAVESVESGVQGHQHSTGQSPTRRVVS